MIPDRVMMCGDEMSNTPAASGTTSVRAAMAATLLLLRIWRTVSHFGKVSGTQIENTTIIARST